MRIAFSAARTHPRRLTSARFPPRGGKAFAAATRKFPLRHFRRGAPRARRRVARARASRIDPSTDPFRPSFDAGRGFCSARPRSSARLPPAQGCSPAATDPPRAPVTSVCVVLAPRFDAARLTPSGTPPRASPGNHPRRNRRSPRARTRRTPRHATPCLPSEAAVDPRRATRRRLPRRGALAPTNLPPRRDARPPPPPPLPPPRLLPPGGNAAR